MSGNRSFRSSLATAAVVILSVLAVYALAAWAQMKPTTFVEGFVPNLAATIIAVFLGLPGGLWLNRKAVALQEVREQATRNERLRYALDQLLSAGAYNLEMLRNVPKEMGAGRYFTGFDADLATWETVRRDVDAGLADQELRVRLARFYESLALHLRHQERLVDKLYTPSSLPNHLVRVQTDLGSPLVPFAERLIADLERLQERIAATRDAIRT